MVERDEITSSSQLVSIYTVTIDSAGLVDRYRKVKKQFQFEGTSRPVEGERVVSYTLHWVSKKSNLVIGLSDWSDVYFRYDREKAKWLVDEVVLGGI
jgi:hypothetical protein